jgi:hypothetical protein
LVLSCVGALLFFIGTIFFLVQPHWFWGLIGPSSFNPAEMYEAQNLQVERTRAYEGETQKNVPSGIILHPLFNETERANLQEAENILLRDISLRSRLIHEFGQSLENVNAVVVPAREMHNDLNRDQLGLRPEVWGSSKKNAADLNVEGFTIADDQPVRTTYDGRPRVVITLNAFESPKTLRLTLFHELVHALHVPARKPPWFLIYQSDLAYLPVYQSCISEANLDGSDEVGAWVFLFAFVISLGVTVIVARLNYRRLRAIRSPGA